MICIDCKYGSIASNGMIDCPNEKLNYIDEYFPDDFGCIFGSGMHVLAKGDYVRYGDMKYGYIDKISGDKVFLTDSRTNEGWVVLKSEVNVKQPQIATPEDLIATVSTLSMIARDSLDAVIDEVVKIDYATSDDDKTRIMWKATDRFNEFISEMLHYQEALHDGLRA